MKYIKKKKYHRIKYKIQSPIEVLGDKMRIYNNEARETLAILISKTTELRDRLGDKEIMANLKSLHTMMSKLDEVVIDCAHKLAPYCSPKLESIEVKSNITHKYVIKAPQQIKSTDEWARITGAERVRIDEMTKKDTRLAPIVESIHDYDEEDELEDEINTQKHLLN